MTETEPQAQSDTAPAEKAQNPLVKLLIEFGPLGAFFFTNAKFGIFTATATFMVAVVAALAASWVIERKVAVMPLVTAIFVLVFGGLTLLLKDELFIKLKPTVVNLLFAAILFGGLKTGRIFLKLLLGSAVTLTQEGWQILTVRWAFYFVFLAVLNEVVWRTTSTDTWVLFKVWGIMPLTLVFAMSQVPLLKRHEIAEGGEESGA